LNSTLALISGLGLGLETSGLGLEAFGLETPGLVNIADTSAETYKSYIKYTKWQGTRTWFRVRSYIRCAAERENQQVNAFQWNRTQTSLYQYRGEHGPDRTGLDRNV